MTEGYVFISEGGNYALETQNTGFGSAPTCIIWVANLNDATVFHSATPWASCMSRHLATSLKRAQPLKACSTRVVRLTNVSDNYVNHPAKLHMSTDNE